MGLNTPFLLVNVELKGLISGNLYKKYKKTRKYLEQKKRDSANKKEKSIYEELEFYRKIAEENQRLLKGSPKMYTEEDFLLNYNDHYPDLVKEESETNSESLLTRMSRQNEILSFRKKLEKKKEKSEERRGSGEGKEDSKSQERLIVIKKVKKKKKRFKP